MNNYIWITLVLAGVYVGFLICAAITYKRRPKPQPRESVHVTISCVECCVPLVRVLPDLVTIEGVEEYLLRCVSCGVEIHVNSKPFSAVNQQVKAMVGHV